MNLKCKVWGDLAAVLDSIQPKEFASSAEMRKCFALTQQIRGELKDYSDQLEALTDEARALLAPLQDSFAGSSGDEKAELTRKANKVLEKVNAKRKELEDSEGSEDLDIEVDPNYKSFVKASFDEKIRPKYLKQSAAVEIADAFNID